MRRMIAFLFFLFIAWALSVPTLSWAQTTTITTRCILPHFTRLNGTEIRFGVVAFNNGDQANPVTIQRLTLQDFYGNIAHDSGPAIGVPHPLANNFGTFVDITVVPPGANFIITTVDIFGNGPIPAGNTHGNAMSAIVQWSKAGPARIFQVQGRTVTRQLIQVSPGVFQQGSELASTSFGRHCFDLTSPQNSQRNQWAAGSATRVEIPLRSRCCYKRPQIFLLGLRRSRLRRL